MPLQLMGAHVVVVVATVFQYALADVTDSNAPSTAFASVAPFDGVIDTTRACCRL